MLLLYYKTQSLLKKKINKLAKLWPKAPNILSRQINEVKTNLREIGIAIDNSARDPKTNTKMIQIRKISLTSPESLADENHAQVTSDIPNDNINNHNDKSLDDNEISLGKPLKFMLKIANLTILTILTILYNYFETSRLQTLHTLQTRRKS